MVRTAMAGNYSAFAAAVKAGQPYRPPADPAAADAQSSMSSKDAGTDVERADAAVHIK